ncbi:glycosyltransferase family protein [Mucilaginibacter ginsenosidivorax]|uniref:Glycosyltransferase family 4 protein n=1 Tax=Mucilaginibacter ginsenosidivorax TaxID=862126 RepID=A0A5B8W4Q1_9SPHI|nr:glycosyltransferase family 4 protein [Mucilaginibacter ginsenosidivorax]QEC77912.1 glycosyltransferase family 4 protein [Mucilaginibacter ginsenosidivorax]
MLIKKVCIITQSHLCRNPRVLKEATTLVTAGYDVTILTNIISNDLYQQDLLAISASPGIKLQAISNLSASSFNSFTDKFLNKIGRLLARNFKIESSLALGYGAMRYHSKAKAVKADLYICHQELATYIGTRLLNEGYEVAFDFEDWYSEDLLPEARAERPINLLRHIEAIALNKGTYCITTSNALAKQLAQVYLCPQPKAIYNVFPSPGIIPNKTKAIKKPLKLFWFSQTIGPGRGIEQFMNLLNSVKTGVELHLLGNITTAYREILVTLMPTQHGLYFHSLVGENQLAAKIAGFDIGLAMELGTPPSRNYTITNKFFQYIQSGLPVIASETEGQNEAFDKFKPGFKLPQQPSPEQISELDKWLNDPGSLQLAQQQAIEAAAFYNWENESKKLLQLVNNALEK